MRRRAFLGAAAATVAACASPLVGDRASPASGDPVAATLASLSTEQRVGQLMSVAFHGKTITPAIEAMIRQRGAGGIVLRSENFEDAAGLARLAADLQRIAREAKVPPLLLSIDQEGGPVLRIGRGVTILPGQMALAATPDPAGAVRMAATIAGSELRSIGVGWNLAPDADVNDEPRNPIIGARSFGSDPQRVASLVGAAIGAYAAAGFLSCAKHFPGHGATTTDSHTGLPQIDSDRARLDRVELVPFKAAIAAGTPAIMSAHMVVPALDPTPSLPVTLSKRVMTDLLRGELAFQGLVVSDDLEMGALATVGEAQAGLMAFLAGVDHLLFRFDESAQLEAHRLLVDAVRGGKITTSRLDASVTRVLAAKLTAGLFDTRAAPAPDLEQNGRTAMDLARQSITVLKNDGVLPLRGAVLAVAAQNADIAQIPGDSDLATELAAVRPNTTARRFVRATDEVIASAVSDARSADVVVVGVADVNTNDDQRRLAVALASAKPTVLVSLRAPYDTLFVPGVAAVVCAYGGRVPSLRATAEVLAGARKPVGRLPVDIPGRYAIGSGIAL